MKIQPGKSLPRLHLEAQARAGQGAVERISGPLLNVLRSAVGALVNPAAKGDWIVIQFYHWVLDDQRGPFRRQLQFLRRFGDFISLDQAVAALQDPAGIRGRYFCVTFDDGFKNCFTNAAPVLKDLGVPAAFFLSTKYVGLDLERDWEAIAGFYETAYLKQKHFFEFLNWEECRQMADAGFTVGSHTHSHARLAELSPAEAAYELRISKSIIESRLERPCAHFCCPWGRAERDYDPLVHPQMAKEAGYVSFLTTNFGINRVGDSVFGIRRIGSTPEEGPMRLRYALFPSWLHSVRARRDGSSRRRRSRRRRTVITLVNDREPIELRRYPFPYQAAFTVASDIDSASPARFRAIHALICGREVIKEGTAEWRTLGLRPSSRWYDKEREGVAGLGLELADSFFLVGDSSTFGMYREGGDGKGFREDDQNGENCSELIRGWIKDGQIDTLHAFLHYTRAQVEPLLRKLYKWCEREGVSKPAVWTNHSAGMTPSGICAQELQPNRFRRLSGLTLRSAVGPLFGRKRHPLRHAFIRYWGATPGSPYYINDLLSNNGVRYVWLNCDDLHRNRICLPMREQQGQATFLHPVTMDDGARYYRFDRCYGKPPRARGEGIYLGDSKFGWDSSFLINETNLKELVERGGTCIFWTHWAHARSFPVSDETISRFKLLRQWKEAGRIWVAPTGRVLEWTRRRTFLDYTCSKEHNKLLVEIKGVNDPIFGYERLELEELDGLSFRVEPGWEVAVAAAGRLLRPDQLGREGNCVWLRTGKSRQELEGSVRALAKV